MPTDFIPDSVENRLIWLTNFKQTVLTEAAILEWPAGKIAGFEDLVNSLITRYQAVVDADTAFRHAKGDAKDIFAASSERLRAVVAEIKTNPAFTEGMGEAMRIFTTASGPLPGDIKPALKASAERGHVVISGSKNYAETVNIYMRRKAGPAGQWNLIAIKRKSFPYEDASPLSVPGVPEEREYMARGVIGDNEVGQDSDIVSVMFAG